MVTDLPSGTELLNFLFQFLIFGAVILIIVLAVIKMYKSKEVLKSLGKDPREAIEWSLILTSVGEAVLLIAMATAVDPLRGTPPIPIANALATYIMPVIFEIICAAAFANVIGKMFEDGQINRRDAKDFIFAVCVFFVGSLFTGWLFVLFLESRGLIKLYLDENLVFYLPHTWFKITVNSSIQFPIGPTISIICTPVLELMGVGANIYYSKDKPKKSDKDKKDDSVRKNRELTEKEKKLHENIEKRGQQNQEKDKKEEAKRIQEEIDKLEKAKDTATKPENKATIEKAIEKKKEQLAQLGK